MLIAITGASGFIATSIKEKFRIEDAQFISLKRNETDDEWNRKLQQANVVINLAGSPVIQRWTKKNKKIILESRVNTTRRLVNLLNQLENGPELFISASAIGIYPDKGADVLTEDSSLTGDGFLSQVVKNWEAAARNLKTQNTRLVIARIGVVIGLNGGLLKKTLPLFKLGLGGKIASGKQALSFIHIDDIVRAFQFFIEHSKTRGVYNLVAPNLTTNAEFTRTLSKALKRPAIIPVPAFALKVLYGKASHIMINGEKVYPKKLVDDGFQFSHPTIESAIQKVVG